LRQAGISDSLAKLADEGTGDGRVVAAVDHLDRQNVQGPNQLSTVRKLKRKKEIIVKTETGFYVVLEFIS
jgi:hypothetical protein